MRRESFSALFRHAGGIGDSLIFTFKAVEYVIRGVVPRSAAERLPHARGGCFSSPPLPLWLITADFAASSRPVMLFSLSYLLQR